MDCEVSESKTALQIRITIQFAQEKQAKVPESANWLLCTGWQMFLKMAALQKY